jgi:hypothetical protein
LALNTSGSTERHEVIDNRYLLVGARLPEVLMGVIERLMTEKFGKDIIPHRVKYRMLKR